MMDPTAIPWGIPAKGTVPPGPCSPRQQRVTQFPSSGTQPCAASGFPEPLRPAGSLTQHTWRGRQQCLIFTDVAVPAPAITHLRGMGVQRGDGTEHLAAQHPPTPIQQGPHNQGFITQHFPVGMLHGVEWMLCPCSISVPRQD